MRAPVLLLLAAIGSAVAPTTLSGQARGATRTASRDPNQYTAEPKLFVETCTNGGGHFARGTQFVHATPGSVRQVAMAMLPLMGDLDPSVRQCAADVLRDLVIANPANISNANVISAIAKRLRVEPVREIRETLYKVLRADEYDRMRATSPYGPLAGDLVTYALDSLPAWRQGMLAMVKAAAPESRSSIAFTGEWEFLITTLRNLGGSAGPTAAELGAWLDFLEPGISARSNMVGMVAPALAAMGEHAAPAVAPVVQLLEAKRNREYSDCGSGDECLLLGEVLGAAGADTILIRYAQDDDPSYRRVAARGLAHSKAPGTVRALARVVADTARLHAVREPSTVKDANLRRGIQSARIEALRSLGLHGTAALPALGVVAAVANSVDDREVIEEARTALPRIRGTQPSTK